MSTHANRVKMTVASVAADPYTITLDAASSGFRSFATAYGANATVDVLITMGTTWEIARNCTYTHSGTTLTRGTLENSSTGSRITTFDNTAVVSVIATAAFGNNVALAHVSGTDADTTMAVGNIYVTDMSAWATADRTYTLPATAAVGDRIGIMVTAGDASHELIIKPNTGDTINGGSAAAEWSRLFITGEVVILRCVTADSAWVVEYDGRKPMIIEVTANGSTTQTPTAGGNTQLQAVFSSVVTDNGNNWDTTNKRLAPRRAGTWNVSALCTMSGIEGENAVLIFAQKGGGGTYIANSPLNLQPAGGSFNIAVGISTNVVLTAAETLEIYVYYTDTAPSADKSTTSGANENYFRAVWIGD